MKKLFLDIETIPADVANEKTRTALEYLYERKKHKNPDSVETFDEFVGKTSFDGSFGRIACIA